MGPVLESVLKFLVRWMLFSIGLILVGLTVSTAFVLLTSFICWSAQPLKETFGNPGFWLGFGVAVRAVVGVCFFGALITGDLD